MDISRRKFLRLAPASVGAFAVGMVVLPEHRDTADMIFRAFKKMLLPNPTIETLLIAGQKAADPPLMDEWIWMPEPGGTVISRKQILPDFYAGDWVDKLNEVKG